MVFEAGVPLIESISAITAAITLLVGAVRAIPLTEYRIEILDSQGKSKNRKTKPKLTHSGHIVVPHHQNAAISLYRNGGGLQTVFYVKDRSTQNKETSRALIMGLRGQVLATLSSLNKKISLPSLGLVFKYTPPKRAA